MAVALRDRGSVADVQMEHSPNLEQWQMIARAIGWFVRCHLGEMPPDQRIAWRGRTCNPGQDVPGPKS